MDHPSDATTADNGGNLDPQQARRKFQPSPPLLSVLRAVVVLGAFGGI